VIFSQGGGTTTLPPPYGHVWVGVDCGAIQQQNSNIDYSYENLEKAVINGKPVLESADENVY
jgi:hypothetical protein